MQINVLLVSIIAILSIVIVLLFLKKSRQIQFAKIEGALKRINEFASHQYVYSDKIEYKESLPFPLLKHFINKSFSQIVIGKIKIGINLEKVEIKRSINKFEISIPELMIIGHELEMGKVGIQSKNMLYQHDIFDYNNFIFEWKKQKENEVLKNTDIITIAYKELKNIITGLLLASKIANTQNIIYTVQMPTLLLFPEPPVNEI